MNYQWGQRYKKNRTPTKDVRFFNSFYLSETDISYLSQIRFEQFIRQHQRYHPAQELAQLR